MSLYLCKNVNLFLFPSELPVAPRLNRITTDKIRRADPRHVGARLPNVPHYISPVLHSNHSTLGSISKHTQKLKH